MATDSVTTKRAFVLSGGASHGSIQVGMALALEERDITPDLVVGTSVGAINGAWLASGRSALGLAAVWKTLRRKDLFPTRPLLGLRAFIGRSTHFVPDSGLRHLVRNHVPFDNLEDAITPFIVVATDALTGQEVLLDHGDAIDAIVASSSLPAVFPAVRVDGRLLVDGAVVNNTPITAAIEAGATEVWVLPAGYANDLETPPDTALSAALHAVGLMVQRRLVLEVASHTYSVPVRFIPPPNTHEISPIDFSHSAELIEQAADNTRDWLDAGQPDSTPTHVHDPEHDPSH